MSARAERLLEAVQAAGADAMLVTNLINVRYLTGFTGSNGLVFAGVDRREFLTDFRYTESSAAEVEGTFSRHTIAGGDLLEGVAQLLPEGRLRLAFEEEHTAVKRHREIVERFGDRVELVGVSGIVEGLRRVKDDEERARIRAATELADAALRRTLGEGLEGRTERDVAVALETDMRRRGASGASFDTIIAAGPHGARPHASPRDVEMRRGDLVVVDWGAVLDGYCSDCTRTYSIGEPSAEAREVYDLVLEAQLAGLHAVRAGADGRATDAAARDVISGAGHGEHFGHGLGHGVGMEVHEAPNLSPRSKDTLLAGNVVTVEPGVYLPGKLGVRIEDLVFVTEDGGEVFTSLSKELTSVD